MAYHATMLRGVVAEPIAQALKTQTVVKLKEFKITKIGKEKALLFAKVNVGKQYDFPAAFGLFFAPYRDWQKDDRWNCVEFAAALLDVAGKRIFEDSGHVTLPMLMQINGEL